MEAALNEVENRNNRHKTYTFGNELHIPGRNENSILKSMSVPSNSQFDDFDLEDDDDLFLCIDDTGGLTKQSLSNSNVESTNLIDKSVNKVIQSMKSTIRSQNANSIVLPMRNNSISMKKNIVSDPFMYICCFPKNLTSKVGFSFWN